MHLFVALAFIKRPDNTINTFKSKKQNLSVLLKYAVFKGTCVRQKLVTELTNTGEPRLLPAQLSAGDDVIAVGERLAPDGGSDLAQQPGAVLTGFTPNSASGLGRSWTFRNHNGCYNRQFVLFVYLYLCLPASPVQQVTLPDFCR